MSTKTTAESVFFGGRHIPIVGVAGLNDHLYLKPLVERQKRPVIWTHTAKDLDVPIDICARVDGTSPKTARTHIVRREGYLAGHSYCGWDPENVARCTPVDRDGWERRLLCKACATPWQLDRVLGRTVRVAPAVGEIALAYPDPERAVASRRTKKAAPKECDCSTKFCQAQRARRKALRG